MHHRPTFQRSFCALFSLTVLAIVAPVCLAAQVTVEIKGDYPELQENASAFLQEIDGRSPEGLRRYASTASSQVSKALRALGYYNPDIQWEIIRPEGEDGLAQLKLSVAPGQPVRIRSRTVEISGPGSDDPVLTSELPHHPAVGDVLDHGEYRTLRQTIQNRARQRGYFGGSFETRLLEVHPEQYAADITLIYQSGPRFELGEVRFEDGHGFDVSFLDQFVTFEPGTAYNSAKIAKLSSDLSNSGYFSSVDVDADPSLAEDGVIPVMISLRTRDPRSVAAGIGFSTDIGPRLRGTWREHWINEWGHRRGAETELSQPRQNLTAWYEVPLDPPMTDSLRSSAGYQREEIEDVESELIMLEQQWNHQQASGWLQTVSLKLEEERFRFGDGSRESTRLLLPGLGYSRFESDSAFDPSRGYRLSATVMGAHRAVVSDVDVLHVLMLAQGLYTVADDHRFLARVRLGGVATNEFDRVPPSLRFFAGGDQSVRGYGYESLSPENSDGVGVGGRYLMSGSLEYQYEFINNWRVATFVDRGNAVSDLSDSLATGAGLGLRWVSPVGPLRLDIAKGLNPEFGGGWRVHFSMGPEL